MATLTANPQINGGGANVTCDGLITSGFGATMTIAHNTGTGDGVNTNGVKSAIRALQNVSGTYLGRCGVSFDTSSLTSGATISSAVLSLFGDSLNFINQSSTSVAIVGTTPANKNDLVVADFGQFQFTAFASPIAFASLSQSAYNDFTLNASGISAINKTGVTSFGVITEVDRAITTITAQDNIFNFIMADTGSNQPKLVVTYTLGGRTRTLTLLGV